MFKAQSINHRRLNIWDCLPWGSSSMPERFQTPKALSERNLDHVHHFEGYVRMETGAWDS
jgi:hypothetical protein